MRLKLTIKEIEFDGDVDALRGALPFVGELLAGALTGESPVSVPSPKPAELPEPAPVAEPCRGKVEANRGRKSKREPKEETGPLRINTGRSADEETLAALRKHGPCDKNKIAEAVGASPAAVYQRLWKLIGQGRASQPSKGLYQVIE